MEKLKYRDKFSKLFDFGYFISVDIVFNRDENKPGKLQFLKDFKERYNSGLKETKEFSEGFRYFYIKDGSPESIKALWENLFGRCFVKMCINFYSTDIEWINDLPNYSFFQLSMDNNPSITCETYIIGKA